MTGHPARTTGAGPRQLIGRARLLLALASCLALVTASCSQGEGDPRGQRERPRHGATTTTARIVTTRPGSPDPSPTTTVTPAQPSPPISWKPCDGGFECGRLAVPVDHSRPTGPTIELGLVRHKATDPAHRIGALMLNPGGPGRSAIDLVEGISLPPPLMDRFDLVGFDPRGTGRSQALNCRTHLQQIYDDDPSPDDGAERAELIRDSQAFVDECRRRHGEVLPFLGTSDVARDMDLVRTAIGEEQLTYLGYSYGTSIGQEYASLFPARVRAMVLDGAVDLSLDGLRGAEGQAAGFTTAFDAFVHHCDQEGCGLEGPAEKVVADVVAQAERRPISAPDSNRPAGPGVVNLGITQGLYSEDLWAALGRSLGDAQDGDGSGLVDLADEYLQRNDDGSYESGFEIYFAVSCLDQEFPRDAKAVLAAGARAEARYPGFGAAIVNDYVRCALWPTPAKPIQPVPATTKGLPPIVVISTTHDPATPYRNGVRVAEQIPGAVLVTNEGEGHTIYAAGKACIDDAVTGYLVTVTAPERGLTCS